MGRSQETFGKKDREKKKLKQRQDKQEKMEERKANAKQGKSLDDMMAYIDEDGNISSTPPDPKRKEYLTRKICRSVFRKKKTDQKEKLPEQVLLLFLIMIKALDLLKTSKPLKVYLYTQTSSLSQLERMIK